MENTEALPSTHASAQHACGQTDQRPQAGSGWYSVLTRISGGPEAIGHNPPNIAKTGRMAESPLKTTPVFIKMNTQKKTSREYGLVYSTAHGRMCPNCRKPIADCLCKQAPPPKTDGIVRVRRETKGRAGKGVTVITGLPLAGTELEKLAKTLKQRCGTGGTVKNGTIEIQGDHRDLIVSELSGHGWVVKKAGG